MNYKFKGSKFVLINSEGNEKKFIKNKETKTGSFTELKVQLKKPSFYNVLLHNDDYTPMEFVVYILISIFHKSNEEATQIMLHVHQKGIGVCGSYPREVAETKVLQVLDNAKKNEHPLQCSMKKV